MKKNILILESTDVLTKTFVQEGKVKYDEDIQVYTARSAHEGICLAMDCYIDVFVVDFDIGKSSKTDGLQFVEYLRQQDRYRFTPVIAVSDTKDPMQYAYSHLHCYQYFEKPVVMKQFAETIQETLQCPITNREKSHHFFKIKGVYQAIHTEDIIYTESHNRELEIYTREERYVVPYLTCEQFLRRYHSQDFIQCSKHTIVNQTYISQVDMPNRYIHLTQGYGHVEIGPAYKKKLEQYIKNRM